MNRAPKRDSFLPSPQQAGVALSLLLGLFFTAQRNYVLFHTVAEGFAIVVAVMIYVVATNTHRHSRQDFLLFLGNAYLFVAILDFVHTMTYQGMGVFPGYTANTPTQLWIASRYVDAVSLLLAPLFLRLSFPRGAGFLLYAAVTAALVASIMWWNVFPDAFVPGRGLTTFKIASEYAISLLLLIAILHLRSRRNELDRRMYLLLVAAMATTILSELSFTLYTDVYGLMNFVGHIFKIIAYYLVFQGVVVQGLEAPYAEIQRLNRDLEGRVQERTARLEREIAERARAEEELRRSETRFRKVFEEGPLGIAITGLDFRFVSVNSMLCQITGYAEHELTTLTFPDITHPDDVAKDVAHARRLLNGEIGQYKTVKRYIKKNGELIWVSLTASVVRDDRGAPLYFLTMVEDITERHELDRLKDQFISVAAHELKTPVAIMKGYAQALLRRADGWGRQGRTMLEAIDRGSDRIDRIVNDLLDISKLHAGRIELDMERLDLPELVTSIVNQKVLTTTKHTVRLVKAEPVVVRGDRSRLEQVLVDLIDNAIKYSPQGGDVDVAVTLQNGSAIVSVSDYGIGIPKDKQGRIFQRFYSAHTNTPYDYGGMGVGLYISKEIVERHGGRMWFQSEEGEGSTFYFSLPLT